MSIGLLRGSRVGVSEFPVLASTKCLLGGRLISLLRYTNNLARGVQVIKTIIAAKYSGVRSVQYAVMD